MIDTLLNNLLFYYSVIAHLFNLVSLLKELTFNFLIYITIPTKVIISVVGTTNHKLLPPSTTGKLNTRIMFSKNPLIADISIDG